MNIKRTIRQFFVQNYKVKIFSLLCSLFLWFYVTLGNQFEDVIDVHIDLINQPANKILIQEIPESIPVRCRGFGGVLLSQKVSGDLHIVIDLSQYPLDTEIPLTLNMIRQDDSDKQILPVRIESKKTLTIAWDDCLDKKVPVIAGLSFQPKQGYTQVGDVQLFPDSVSLKGPAREIRQIDAIRTAQRTFQVLRPIEGEIDLVDSVSSLIKISPAKVRFSVDIQGIGERIFGEIPVQVINVPAGVIVSSVPSTLSLRIHGGVEILKSISKEDIVATIDYRNRFRYGRRIPAMIHVPKYTSFTEAKPKDFELLVNR